MQYYGIDWLATASGLLGVYLLGNKNKIGFLLFMVASVSWITFGIMTGSIAVMIGSSIFFVMHFRGFLRWRKEAELAN
jgi:Nicotinamide mononucleotide transporter